MFPICCFWTVKSRFYFAFKSWFLLILSMFLDYIFILTTPNSLSIYFIFETLSTMFPLECTIFHIKVLSALGYFKSVKQYLLGIKLCFWTYMIKLLPLNLWYRQIIFCPWYNQSHCWSVLKASRTTCFIGKY